MTPQAKEELSKIRKSIRENKGVQSKYISKIKKVNSPWRVIARLLAKLRIDSAISKFYYRQLNLGTKMEALIASYNLSDNTITKQKLKNEIMSLKSKMVNTAAMYVAMNRALNSYKYFTKIAETLGGIWNKDLMTNKIKDHEHLTLLKIDRIGYSIDYARIVLADAMDNILNPLAHRSEVDELSDDKIESPDDVRAEEGGFSMARVLLTGLATISTGMLSSPVHEETEEKGEEVLEELKDQVEEEESSEPSHTFSYPVQSPDLNHKLEEAEKESKGEPVRLPKNKPQMIPTVGLNNRVKRIKEMVDLGVYDSEIDKLTNKAGEENKFFNVPESERQLIRNLPRLLKKGDPKAYEYLSSPRSSIATVFNNIDIDSPVPVSKQLATLNNKVWKEDPKALPNKIRLEFQSQYPDKEQFTQDNIKKFIQEKKYPIKDPDEYAKKVFKLGPVESPDMTGSTQPTQSNQLPTPKTEGKKDESKKEDKKEEKKESPKESNPNTPKSPDSPDPIPQVKRSFGPKITNAIKSVSINNNYHGK